MAVAHMYVRIHTHMNDSQQTKQQSVSDTKLQLN